MKTPFLPEDAPFSDDQKSWLAGFYAGLHTQMAQGQQSASEAEASLTAHIVYGTQTGNSEGVAEDLGASMRSQGINAVVASLDDIEVEALTGMDYLFVVTSTYGEGEMPDNAELFWEALKSTDAPRLEHMQFSVLALGDTAYDEFCEAGKQFDLRLEQLGAKRLQPRVDCDVDFEEDAESWGNGVIEELVKVKPAGAGASTPVNGAAPKAEKSKWTRKNPFESPLTVNHLLSGEGSAKEIRHFEFDLSNDGPKYEAGDALNVIPTNDPALVDAWLKRLGVSGDTAVAGKDQSLEELLFSHYEISTPSNDLVKAVAARAGDDHLTHIVGHGDKEAMEAYLWSKDALDLLLLHPNVELSVDDLIPLFKPLQHRAYSISSSSKKFEDSVHLTIAAVRYDSHGRKHGGVASCYLADRVAQDGPVKVFVSPNKAFRVPENNDVPMIMVGPGTGIAPFRAFLQEREAIGANGMNWLFFGDQHEKCDFIYKDELEAMQNSGVLSRLDLAFSRDQKEKIYVQTRMKENSKDLYAALEEGGSFLVCGDATRMAKDVDRALHEVVAQEGGLSEDGAIEYVNRLKKEKRYVRDVY